MELDAGTRQDITQALLVESRGKFDGSRRNILVSVCPFCGHGGNKFGIYVGPTKSKSKIFGSAHCFHCQKSLRNLEDTLELFGLSELKPKETTNLKDEEETYLTFWEDEIDDSLKAIEMPKGYKRIFKNPYLKSRGFEVDDYEYFPVGTNRGMDIKLKDYVIFPIIMHKQTVGWFARKCMDKHDIEAYNDTHRYMIRRCVNSTDNEFSKLLYNYDAIIPGETDTVILCEGIFDVIGLNRKMELYDNQWIVPVATFGKKISECQMMLLQQKGVRTVVIGYDEDAKETSKEIAANLDKYFDVYVCDIPSNIGKDWDEMDDWDIYDIFSLHLKSTREFNLTI